MGADEVSRLRRAEEVERQLLQALAAIEKPDSFQAWVLRCCLAEAHLEVRKARAAWWAAVTGGA